VLIAERAEGGRPGPAATHYRRMFWLFVFGMIHAYFLWWGDVLTLYAVAGLVIFPFRKTPPRLVLGIGATILLGLLVKNLIGAGHLEALRAAASVPAASADAVKAWQEASVSVIIPPEVKAQEIAAYRGGFLDALQGRAQMAMLVQLVLDPADGLPEAIGQMLIGMALFRMGFFTLGWTTRAYGLLIAAGYLVAAPITAWLAWKIVQADFDPLALHRLEVWSQAPRPFIALAHAGAVLLIVRAGTAPGLIERLAAAGRMAFSNYLMTSIITTFVFCGFGLGLYGRLSRFEQLAVVAGVWAFILIWSKPWLARFHYGPFEWAWRSLVKWSPQPFVRGGIKPAVVA
jgi:uncharacterized protein